MSVAERNNIEVYCDECFRRKWPDGHDEKSCAHGWWHFVCIDCGREHPDRQKPFGHCLGSLP